MIIGGNKRITQSCVTLMRRRASSAIVTSSPQGRSSSTPIIKPLPRIATMPGTPASSRARPSRMRAPWSAALASRFSSSRIRNVSIPARQASGPPPKVVPWLPGPKTPAARLVVAMAPIGTPDRVLGDRHHVGFDVRPLEAEPFAGAPDAGLHFVDHQQPAALVAQFAQCPHVRSIGDIDAALALQHLEQTACTRGSAAAARSTPPGRCRAPG